MAKSNTIFSCQNCGGQSPKWVGQCPDCGAWNTLIEEKMVATKPSSRHQLGYAGAENNRLTSLSQVVADPLARLHSGSSELDRVLGGGLVSGEVVLIGGDPGIGKSTLLLQTVCHLGRERKVLYVSGEESLQQISLRAQRLGLQDSGVMLLTETQVERILNECERDKPQVLIIDSIQTIFTEQLQAAAGSVSQIRESAAALVRFAKQTNTILLMIGHVTKEGTLAGPRVLEHMVDCVLYFENQSDSRFRVVRAVKNRYGTVNEMGVFAMTEKGLRDVTNPSAIFLARPGELTSGSVVTVAWEGTRPLLIEVQALVDQSYLTNPRRVSVGFDHNRLSLLLAVLHRHAGMATGDQDVFVNIVGGLRINDPALDLAVLMAIASSLHNQVLPADLVIWGEVGLGGEIRPVLAGEERIAAAHKQGFKQAMLPKANATKQAALHLLTPKDVASALALVR